MPEDSRIALSQYRLSKAETCLTAAQNLLEDELYLDSVNRSYYAIFHAIRSILALRGLDFKKHSGVIPFFQKEYVKTGIFNSDFSDIARSAFNIRQHCDYDDFYILSKEKVILQLENAQRFVSGVKDYLKTIT